MFTSFSTALSALDATSTAIDVVGNNLANLNTPGFKDSTTYFRDLVTESLGAGLGETQVGFGTGTPMTIRHFTQGAIQSSTGVLDAAIGSVNTKMASSNIVVPVGGVKQPTATTNMTLDFNLNSAAAADATSDHSETIKVYDTLGTSHTLTVNLEKTGANQWSYAVTMPGEDLAGGTAGTPTAISGASGTLTFGTDRKSTRLNS